MRARATSEMARYIRTEVRRRKRELAALRERPQYQGQDGAQPVNVLAEFLGTLTPCEQVFCNEHLLGESSDVVGPTVLHVEHLATQPPHPPQAAPLPGPRVACVVQATVRELFVCFRQP